MRVKNSFMWATTLASLMAIAALPARAAPATLTMVVCSPGSPGSTDEAQPRMDAFAAALSSKAATPITVVYDPSDDGGVTRLKTAGLGLVSLPFFLQHEQALGLHPRLQVVAKGRPALDRWSLVVAKGRVKAASDLAGFSIATSVAFSPSFVRGPLFGGFGALPASAKLTRSTAVLSALRRAANGNPVAVVLDGAQDAQLASLPFASKLEVIARSAPLPTALVVTVGDRTPDAAWSKLERALLGLSSDRAAASVLDAIQLTGFAALDAKTVDAARKAFAEAAP